MHLILHAGPPKTGSTAIQQALWAGQGMLAEHGIDVWRGPEPQEWGLTLGTGRTPRGLFPVLRPYFIDGAEATRWGRQAIGAFDTWLFERPRDVVVATSEHLPNASDRVALYAWLSERFERISMVAYARDPVAHYTSLIGELAKVGLRFADLPGPLGNAYSPYTRLRAWEELLGAGRLVIRPFDQAHLAGGDVVVDFHDALCALSQRSLPQLPEMRPKNESLPGAATAWLLMLNESFICFRAKTTDRDTLKARGALIGRLLDDPDVRALPRLDIDNAPILADALRFTARDEIHWMNATHLSDAAALNPGPDEYPVKKGTKPRHLLRNLLQSYLVDAAVQALFRAAVPMAHHARPPAKTEGAG